MNYIKAENRIDQILKTLKSKRFIEVPIDNPWYTAPTQKTYGESVPGDTLQWERIKNFPFPYGKEWTNYWFSSELPSSLLNSLDGDVYLEVDTETDGMIYIDNRPESATNPKHPLVKLNTFIQRNKNLNIYIECWAGHEFPGYHPSQGSHVFRTVSTEYKRGYPLLFQKPRILLKQESVYELYYDAYVLRELSKTMSNSSLHYMCIIDVLHKELLQLDFENYDSPQLTSEAKRIRTTLTHLLDAKNGTISPEIYSVGNAHLDHAWLWTIDETFRKAARTASTMLNYIEEFEDFSFMFTQPAQMCALREQYPYIFSKILAAYKKRKWEPTGTSWIEPDCMLPAGESLIRQFLLGLETSKELFPGYQNDVFWVPDSFGYNGALPQILLGCGIKYFITSKIGWNDTNKFPYELFLWEGIDGSKIPSQMIIGAYEGTNEPTEIVSIYEKVQHKETQPKLMRSIGEGDGGGGTRLEDLEIMKRIHNLQGLPKNRWTTIHAAMKQIFTPDCINKLPVYKGELYLELHRGTYTSQAKIKKNNKELEVLLHNAEVMASCLFLSDSKQRKLLVAREKIKKAWAIVLTNQFHDILPGSCINKVVQEANASYDLARSLVYEAIQEMQSGDTTNKKYFNFNPTPLHSTGTGDLIAPYSSSMELRGRPKNISISDNTIQTEWGVLTYDNKGGFSSIKLNNGRELVSDHNLFNTVTIGNDTTLNWDAWDMEYDTIPLRRAIHAQGNQTSITVKDQGVEIKQAFQISKCSNLNQVITINPFERRIDFSCTGEWHESHKMLRVNFPTTIAANTAQYSIPFGYISRSTTENTSWERACFESPALNFVMYGDAGTTLVLSSSSKYGYSVKNNVISLSLLKSAKAPDPYADQGYHEFTYSLFIEEGGVNGIPKAIQDGYETLNPAMEISDEPIWRLPLQYSSLRGEVLLETVKISEDNSGIIIRCYESLGTDSKIMIKVDTEQIGSIFETNLLEEIQFEISLDIRNPIELEFHPFQIRTFLLKKHIHQEMEGTCNIQEQGK